MAVPMLPVLRHVGSGVGARHEASVYTMVEQRRADGIEGFADLTDEQIEQEVTGLDDEGKLEEFIDGLTDAHLAEGVLLGVSTSNYVTKKGANFTQITYSTDVDSIRNLISRRAA